ncbi:response regulator transcription factor [Anaerocolumna jejuensis]|uniref:response regulator transcription factor n=1 Tax=Anaerocolumna jejuensis TaxID=259063 RepID=UPI003F7C8AA5
MIQIAIIEDDKGLNNGITLALKNDNYVFHQYFALSEVKDLKSMDLIILDINLPDGNGLDFLKKLRQTSQTPVIILTANDLETDEVMGLELGADDYITKPFSLMVLRARIEKVLKKSRSDSEVFRQDLFYFDFSLMKFTKDGQDIELSKTEQKLLRMLVANKNTALLREVLIDRIWSDGAEYVEENALSVTIKRLRDKLEDNSSKPVYIQTVYGIGYVWRKV